MKSLNTIDDKKLFTILLDVKYEIKKIFGDKLVQLILFGSYARDQHEPGSDIDIMILVQESEEKLRKYKYVIADIMAELSLKHEKLISLIEIPYNRFIHYLDVLPFYKTVHDEGVEIYGKIY